MSSETHVVQGSAAFGLLAKPSLLITESADEYAALLAALRREIKPESAIEEIYLGDLAEIIWEIQRLQRCKAGIVNSAFKLALRNLLKRLLQTSEVFDGSDESSFELTEGWFKNERGKERVRSVLGQYNLDETTIEAEAVKLSWPDLELIERMLMLQRSRFDKTLVCVADYRDKLALRMRKASLPLLEESASICLEHDSKTS